MLEIEGIISELEKAILNRMKKNRALAKSEIVTIVDQGINAIEGKNPDVNKAIERLLVSKYLKDLYQASLNDLYKAGK
jgi:hypothetical protein